jgi:hypothetical protein
MEPEKQGTENTSYPSKDDLRKRKLKSHGSLRLSLKSMKKSYIFSKVMSTKKEGV